MLKSIVDRIDTRSLIAVFMTVSVVALTTVLIFKGIKDLDDTTKTILGGLVTVGLATIINFYFGSSDSSQNKDVTISKIATGKSEQSK